MKVLVCGGRTYSNMGDMSIVLTTLHHQQNFSMLIHGGANGADSLAGSWAKRKGIAVEVYKADWKTYGRSAGPIRNRKMLTEAKPDLVVAFPGGKGTSDMVLLTQKAGVRLIFAAEFLIGLRRK